MRPFFLLTDITNIYILLHKGRFVEHCFFITKDLLNWLSDIGQLKCYREISEHEKPYTEIS